MIAIFVSCLLFIFGLIFTIPPRKINFFPLWLKSFDSPHSCKDHRNPDQELPAKTQIFNTKRSISSSSSSVELRDVFATFDRNDDGFITRHELRESLKNMGISAGEKDVADMVDKVDANGDGLIDLDEFCHLFDTISGGKAGEDDEGRDSDGRDGDLREAFDVFDGNKDGLITVEELGLVLSSLGFTEGKKLEDCKEMIRKVDMDGDGKVNFDEFKQMMRDGLNGIIPLPTK